VSGNDAVGLLGHSKGTFPAQRSMKHLTKDLPLDLNLPCRGESLKTAALSTFQSILAPAIVGHGVLWAIYEHKYFK